MNKLKSLLIVFSMVCLNNVSAQFCDLDVQNDSLKAQDLELYNAKFYYISQQVNKFRDKHPNGVSLPNPPPGGQNINGINCPKAKLYSSCGYSRCP